MHQIKLLGIPLETNVPYCDVNEEGNCTVVKKIQCVSF